MDQADKRLLSALQRDCRQSIAELAEQVSLSPSACHRRIKQLEDSGIIQSYVAELDGRKLGYEMEFLVEVSLHSQGEGSLSAFEKAVRQIPEVLECHLMTGQADYVLRVATRDAGDYERFHRKQLAQLPGVSKIQSSLILRKVSQWTGYPVMSIDP